MANSCGNCQFMEKVGDGFNGRRCRRFPPSLVPKERDHVTLFPVVLESDWCGEHREVTTLEMIR